VAVHEGRARARGRAFLSTPTPVREGHDPFPRRRPWRDRAAARGSSANLYPESHLTTSPRRAPRRARAAEIIIPRGGRRPALSETTSPAARLSSRRTWCGSGGFSAEGPGPSATGRRGRTRDKPLRRPALMPRKETQRSIDQESGPAAQRGRGYGDQAAARAPGNPGPGDRPCCLSARRSTAGGGWRPSSGRPPSGDYEPAGAPPRPDDKQRPGESGLARPVTAAQLRVTPPAEHAFAP